MYPVGRHGECGVNDPPSPAAEAGVEAGDVIVAVDGVPYDDWTAVVDEVRGRPGDEIVLTVERDGSPMDLLRHRWQYAGAE